ncbi:hypothetical protein Tco_0376682, partial [Tanacetum coccineum]
WFLPFLPLLLPSSVLGQKILKSGDLNLSRLSDLKCLLDDRNSRSDDRYAVSNGSGYAVSVE